MSKKYNFIWDNREYWESHLIRYFFYPLAKQLKISPTGNPEDFIYEGITEDQSRRWRVGRFRWPDGLTVGIAPTIGSKKTNGYIDVGEVFYWKKNKAPSNKKIIDFGIKKGVVLDELCGDVFFIRDFPQAEFNEEFKKFMKRIHKGDL